MKDLSIFQQGKYHEINGLSLLQKDKHHLAFEALQNSKENYTSIDSISNINRINLYIIDLLAHQNDIKVSSQPYINEFLNYANKSNNIKDKTEAASTLAVIYLKANDGQKSIKYFNKAIDLALKAKDSILATDYLFNKGVVYSEVLKDYEKALKIFKEVVPIYEKNKDYTYIAYSYNNQAEVYKKKKEYKIALEYYNKAFSIRLDKNNLKSKEIFYENIIPLLDSLGKYKEAYQHSNELITLKDSIDDSEQNTAIIDAEKKYRTSEKEKENLILEKQKTKNKNVAIGLGGSLALGSIIAFLLFKNTKRKQKLAEQEKEIESQKLATVLKEQELTAIDAMIEGQEKERQRIANDLHDDLGGLMATVKLHFNALKDKHSPELFDKTNSLIEEAYQKIRSVAHAKNSGVIAKQGLLKAVQNMADNISASNKIQIDVIDHGLDNRLENSLELTIFRVIQELITNVIKHARASEVTIHLTNHDDSINIMVEDNGKGFNPSQITKTNKGMGISSIDKRIEHLDGKLTIESEKNQGTTVIIDIPV
ncbi:sensor histidine kinase [uncultured Winogradskyella sp.]|uniref:tetratricopeptide repeat-containing sensor histidine kinase n=1 Tax=uncultured Winogradskyella sp. TaxID=395353 RepID=UPI002631560A|nr:sensor histidine kinase [uncultured Winogradskyella sp.]